MVGIGPGWNLYLGLLRQRRRQRIKEIAAQRAALEAELRVHEQSMPKVYNYYCRWCGLQLKTEVPQCPECGKGPLAKVEK
jgi:rubrerythrin